ncbi:hypothetical protein LTR10_020010 [Elasticomyces elasticus]|uniref:Luciferase domain-containing protein n=1 Tax=Exophiala sideris TaxID=1016849 RepID=A0ABR0JMY7_9EURO|nr:hypothetical protein LTR10_020010 [Elasticomyces elasticus]KAK5037836.1 hypothetical protein LTS07_001303 [Exophiala sideris]KAK5043819.1 hypothetical protein LTR13_000173 [Exophiala sideris]KAK5067318.1 hypothetical protein LTR69_001305 [Exophiala sideris]KAK5182651.1 hypothetical protein LTR44_005042 [Eurotiomycetes sp. CCFEE 6388]
MPGKRSISNSLQGKYTPLLNKTIVDCWPLSSAVGRTSTASSVFKVNKTQPSTVSTMSSSLTTYYHNLTRYVATRPREAALTSTAIAVTLSLAWVLSDFYAWKAFGTGGTPPTWAGYWRMTKIRINRFLLFGKDDLADASNLSSKGSKYLDAGKIPIRQGERPRLIARTMPQRQVPYDKRVVAPLVEDRVASMVATFATKYSDILEVRPSKTEGGSTDAIYAKPELPTLNPLAQNNKMLTTEIAHAHPSEGSLHVWLSEADAKTVVEKGWGMRFPLYFVPKGWAMVYAPRTMEEVDVVETIVKAGIAFIAGVEV